MAWEILSTPLIIHKHVFTSAIGCCCCFSNAGVLSYQRGVGMVKTVVQPKPLSSYMIDVPAMPTVEQVTVSVPVLQLPGTDANQRATSPHLEVGAAGMLQVRILNCMLYFALTTTHMCSFIPKSHFVIELNFSGDIKLLSIFKQAALMLKFYFRFWFCSAFEMRLLSISLVEKLKIGSKITSYSFIFLMAGITSYKNV